VSSNPVDDLSDLQKMRMICLNHGRQDCPNDWLGAPRAARAYEQYIIDGTVDNVVKADLSARREGDGGVMGVSEALTRIAARSNGGTKA
jgi:hypothetical protein